MHRSRRRFKSRSRSILGLLPPRYLAESRGTMHPISLDAERLRLRELTHDDKNALYKVYGDPESTRHLSIEPRSLEQIEETIGSAIKSAQTQPREVYMLAIASTDTNELVGAARLGTGEYQSGQIGFAMRPDQWGHGKGTETVHLLQYLGFCVLKLHRIWGARSPVNEASARTMRGAGMVEEGTIRGHLYTRGAWRDSVVHSILSDEYTPAPAIRPTIDEGRLDAGA
jgi:[ribosomal protein S5]-alanine N-acetyltransferase